METSSSFYFPSNSPPELSNSNSSPDSSSSDGTAGEDPSTTLHHQGIDEGRRNTIRIEEPFASTTTNHYPFIHPHLMNGNDKVHQSQLPFNMNQFSNDNAAVYSPFQNGSGQVQSPTTNGNSRIGKSSDSSTLSELTSSDDDVSIFGNGSNHGNAPKGNAVVALGNSMFSYTKNFTSEPTSSGLPRNGNDSGQGRSSLEDWNSNVNQHQQQHQNGLTSEFHRLHNGSLTQPYNDPVRNGRNPPTTIPRLHSNSISHSNRPFNGVGSSNAMQLDGNGNGNADGDEDMFESLIQEDSFDPPSLRNSVSPQQSLKMLPQAGLSISTAPDRIPPSYYPSQSGLRNSKGSGRISAGAEGESGSPPLSADPSVLSSRRNSISERNGDQSMGSATGIPALTPSIGGTSSYASGDDDPLPSSATSHHDNQATSTPSNAPKSKNPKSKSTSNPIPIDTGLTPEGEIPFSSKKRDLVHPSISDLNEEGSGKLQVHVHGLPRKGAKSRVETQVKMRLELVREKIGNQGASASSSTSTSDEKEWERIGSFTHLKLPPFSGSKRSQKKFQFDNVDPEKTLFVDVVVVKASPPHEKVTICEHCTKREARKAQRGKNASTKDVKKGGNDEENATDEDDYKFFGIDRSLENSKELLKEQSAEAELNRSVVFNCGDYLEFEDGNVVLPTRITCYCRHHSEKLGFCIIFTMRDWQSNVVATGSTPPIMITDDHKATSKAQKEKAEEGSGAVASTTGNGSGKQKSTSKSKNTKASASTLAKAGKASERGVGRTTYNSAASRVSSPSKDTLPDATQTDQDPSNQPVASASAVSKKKERAKPYDKSTSSKSRKRSESGNASMVSSPQDPRSGNVTRNVTPARNSPSSPPHHQPPFSTIEQNEDWTSFAAAAGFMSRTASDSGRSMTTAANAFSPISNSSMTAEPQSMNTAQIPPSPIAPQDEIPSHMQGSLSSTNLQTNLQSTPAFDLERFLRDAQGGIPVDSSGLQEFIALNGGSRVGNENGNGMDLDTINPQQQHLQQPRFSHSEPQSNYQNAFQQPTPSTSTLQQPQLPTSISSQSPPPASMVPSIPAPRVEKLIPGEGPTSGGVEVTVLGSGFYPGLRCVFGDVQAPETKVWASNTLVCVLPPSQSPGPVVVSLKRIMESGELRDFDGSNDHNNHPLRFFTYVDKTDRALMELALQVVGLQMTGQMQSARDVAMRVVGSGGAGSNGPSPNGGGGSSSTPSGQSRSTGAASGTDEISGLFAAGRGSTQSFQTSLLGFLSLLDVDFSNESTLPNGVPRLDALRLANSQGHTLLHLAVILGLHKLVEALLARKYPAPVNARDNNGYTALHFAALHGRMTIARTLLSRKARDDLVNVEGKIPLELAREKDQVDVEMLLSENSSENVRNRMMMDPSPRLSVSESESVSDEEQDGESIENSSEEEEEDIDEDNISTCASHVETSSDEGSSQEDVDEELLNSQVDLNIVPSSIVEKGIRTPQALSTPQDEKKDPLFSSKLDERKDRESSKLQKEKEKEVESTNNSPGTETNLAFKDWLIQAGDSVRAGHGLEWAASNLPSGRRALQLIPRPNMALNMHMPAVPVFHLALPTTPRFGNLPWTNSNSSSTATTPSVSSSKGKDKELSQSNPEGSSKAHSNEEIHSSHSLSGAEAWASDEARRVINMCKSIVEESALWLNPLYQPLDSSPPPTYESALASTSKEDLTQDSRLVEDDEIKDEVDSGKDQGLQLQSGEESKFSKSSSTNHRRPSVTSRSTWNGKASDRMEDESALIDLRENEIAGPSSKRIARPSSALSAPSSSPNLLSTSSASSSSSTSIPALVSTSTSIASTSCNRRRTRTQAQPRRGLRDDLMLIFFWFPALIVVILLLFFSKNTSIFSLDELLSFIPGPIATATKVVRSGSSSGNAVETSPF